MVVETKHLQGDDSLLRSMTILITSTRTQLQFYIQMVTTVLKAAFRMTVNRLNESADMKNQYYN
jgi:K+ transporter